MYSLLMHFFAWVMRFIALFNRKAQLMVKGQRQTERILREGIQKGEQYIWFHAASLGEFEQGRPLMERIKADYPQYKLLLTFFSPSGYEVRKHYAGADVICYLPFDTPGRVHRFLDLARPVAAVFIKYEFWGNYLKGLKQRHIPVFIISSIFRPTQLFFQWYGAPYRRMLHYFTHIFVQDARSEALLQQFGITNVTVTGDTRFDRVLDIQQAAQEAPVVDAFVHDKAGNKRFTLVAGSSWPQDEAFLLPYFNAHPEMKLVIAPHEIHEAHLAAIERALSRPAIRLSQVKEASDIQGKECLIIDCFGLLSSIYRYGEVAYVGGGFGAGIHNTLEAAVYGVPVLFGPNFQKFKEAKDLIAAGGGISVANGQEFAAQMDRFQSDAQALAAAGKAAGQFVQQNAGSTARILPALMAQIQSA